MYNIIVNLYSEKTTQEDMKMKKVLSLILAIMMLLSTTALVSAKSFTDVDSNYSWAQEAIEALSEDGIITGYEDGTFKPGKNITKQEAITLFSKALGAGEEVNATIIDLAYGIYEKDLENCTDSYAVKQGAYMIYRKVLTAAEVISYLSPDNRNVELKRFEAATLIAKALGADSWLESNPDITLEFDDAKDIPENAKGYVYYATALGIMNGMGDNKFGGNETVTRAQIAVMIKRILNTMEFDYIYGMISDVNPLGTTVSIKTSNGENEIYNVGLKSPIFLDGIKVSIEDLKVGMECVFIFSKGAIYQIDAVNYSGEETVSGAFRGYQTTNSGTTVRIADVNSEGSPVSTYTLAASAVVSYNGQASTLSNIALNDFVMVDIRGGLVNTLNAEAKTQVVPSVKIVDIDTSAAGVIITVTNNKNEETSYALGADATITRNGAKVTFSELAIGDNAELTLEYRQIKSVMAIGKEKSSQGLIEEITISNSTSYITVSNNGVKTTYPMARDCGVVLEEENATIYDLRLNAYVKLTLSSDTVTKIESEAVSNALSVTGTVKTINTSYGLVVISCEGAGGTVYDKQLFIKDSTKIINAQTGKSLTIKGLKVGNIITAAGTEQLGVYEVTSLMILQ